MESNLTSREKFKLLDINIEDFNKEVKKELFTEESYIISKEELELIEKIIADSIELEIDTEVPEDTTRASFCIFEDKVLVIRRKKINIKLLVDLLFTFKRFLVEGTGTRTILILKSIYNLFVSILDEDTSILYSYLCKEYFQNGKKFDNEEVFFAVNEYFKENFGITWSDDRINGMLLKLEDLKVIEFDNKMLEVKDKIYF